MARGGDAGHTALLDIRHSRRHQPRPGTNHDKTGGSAERKRLVAKTVGKTFVALSQLQCSRKSPRPALRKSMRKIPQKRISTASLRLSSPAPSLVLRRRATV